MRGGNIAWIIVGDRAMRMGQRAADCVLRKRASSRQPGLGGVIGCCRDIPACARRHADGLPSRWLDLWNLHGDWLKGGSGPLLERLPSEVWMVGMGNLGQAYLWTVGLLPYGHKALRLVLQDTDIVTHSNLSTSMLTNRTCFALRRRAQWQNGRRLEVSRPRLSSETSRPILWLGLASPA
jgi:hypothetical protein